MSLAPPHLSPSPLAPGYKLDRYELLCPIAEGGMASLWIARQTGKHGFQKLVAIKTILPKYASDPNFQQMFLDEVRIASRIEHANVTQILDVGEQHGVTYLVMEYVDGDALSKLHRAAREKKQLMHQGVLLRVMADACGGLHAAHELHGADGALLGVVHRDVSPQNILVSTKGVSKLIDFGIAKARNRLAEDTNAGQLKGKVRYMAPEQASATGRSPVDRRADIWAVGAVLYHLLSGRAPFEGENEVKTLFLLTSGRPPTPMRTNVHPAVAAVVRRSALPRARQARYATAAELQQALEEAIAEAGLATTTAEVAAYVSKEVGVRVFKRKEAIALGLSAADARERYADIMRANTDKSRRRLGHRRHERVDCAQRPRRGKRDKRDKRGKRGKRDEQRQRLERPERDGRARDRRAAQRARRSSRVGGRDRARRVVQVVHRAHARLRRGRDWNPRRRAGSEARDRGLHRRSRDLGPRPERAPRAEGQGRRRAAVARAGRNRLRRGGSGRQRSAPVDVHGRAGPPPRSGRLGDAASGSPSRSRARARSGARAPGREARSPPRLHRHARVAGRRDARARNPASAARPEACASAHAHHSRPEGERWFLAALEPPPGSLRRSSPPLRPTPIPPPPTARPRAR